MKKAVVFLCVFISIFTFGCDKKEPYDKEVNSYRITHSNVEKDIYFEFINDENYTVKTTNGSIKLTNEVNKTRIELYFYYDYSASNTITKKKHDFALESHKGFRKVKVNNHEGWEVYLINSLFTNYETNLILTEPDEDNKVYAVDIKVIQSPLNTDESFDTKEFVKGEDFKHLLNSLKVIDKEIEEE